MPSSRSRRARIGQRLESLEARLVLDSTVVFNEVMYHPLDDAPGKEYVELHNQMAIDMDLSGWSLAGGIDYKFPTGTVVAGGGYLVIAADPAALGVPGALGPFTGALSNSGETIDLINNSARVMDSIDYKDAGVWPAGADGSGASLAKINRDSATEVPENWHASRQVNGTPGASNDDPAAASSLVLNEVGAGGSATTELYNPGTSSIALAGYVIARAGGGATQKAILGAESLAPGAYKTVPTALGFSPEAGDRLFLYAPGETQLLDALVVDAAAQGRFPDGADWRFTSANTFGGPNVVSIEDDVVINEIMYHHRPIEAQEASVVQETLLPIDAEWRYNASGANIGTAWSAVGFNDSAWPASDALFYNETSDLPAPKNTPLALGPITYYFRTSFDFQGDPAAADLRLRTILDDGAVFYLNGHEVKRINLPDGEIVFDTGATVQVNNAEYSDYLSISTEHLQVGKNELAVEVHQVNNLSNDVAFGAEVSVILEETPAIPYHESPEEWIELYNRGDAPVDLSGWRLDDAVDFVFPANTVLAAGAYLVVAADPAAFSNTFPGVAVVGPWDGTLSNSNERIRLLDARRNPADEVHYFDGGRWPGAADAGGSSLELRDPWSDNSRAEAWSASDEGAKPGNEWQTYAYQGNGAGGASPPVNYNEFVMGLLDSGEVLIDDVRVTDLTTTGTPQIIQNSTFDVDAATWRIIGNHSGSVVVDPDDPTNHVLRLVATGSTEHMHNHAETTVKNGANYVSLSNRNTYEISFRAKWISGSNQLNTRLWFNRTPETTRLPVVSRNGSPGAENSRAEANIGPTFHEFQHGPVVPAANAPVTVSVAIDDPQGVASATLFYSAAGGAWTSVPMTLDATTGKYAGVIPGRPAATVVQFYVEATDALGVTSTYPAEGAASRALYIVNDNLANLPLTHNVRIVMTAADTNQLFLNTNLMSNADIGATVIYNESEVFYNVGVRLKGSEHGRADNNRIGYILHFDPDHLFRGVHDSVAIDRSGGWRNGTSFGQDEIVIRQIFNRAGNMPLMYDDLIRVISPRSSHTGSAILQMSRYDNDFLDTQYENGSDGTTFEYELLYALSQTVGGVEGLKIPQEGGVTGTALGNLGDDPEAYRNYYLIKNNKDRDDYASLIPALKTFSLSGAAFLAEAEARLDVDEWLRAFAASTLVGPADNYATGAQHNLILYVRPSDGKLLYLPWDMDFAFVAGATSSLVQNGDLSKLLQSPQNLRNYRGHLLDILDTSFNTAYMTYWTNHLDDFLPGQNFNSILSYIGQRAAFARAQLPAQIPFNITTNGGAPLEVATPTTVITGDGWINIREIRLQGMSEPLQVTWLDGDTWEATVPLAFGVNQLTLEAYGYQGQFLTSDTIEVTSTAIDRPLQEFLRITELMYHPLDPSAAEIAAGFTDADEFEYLEIVNTSATETLTLTGVRLAGGIDFMFPEMTLAPGEYAVVAENADALAFRYDATNIRIAGQYTGRLSNSGEALQLLDPASATILDFSFSDAWYSVTDGSGKSLVVIDATAAPESWNEAASWRASLQAGGSPGRADVAAVEGDTDGNGTVDLADLNNVRNNFGASGPNVVGDTNGDGQVDLTDLNAVRNNFGAGGASDSTIAPNTRLAAAPALINSHEKATDHLLESLSWLEWQRVTADAWPDLLPGRMQSLRPRNRL